MDYDGGDEDGGETPIDPIHGGWLTLRAVSRRSLVRYGYGVSRSEILRDARSVVCVWQPDHPTRTARPRGP